jgi:hypothetical protein
MSKLLLTGAVSAAAHKVKSVLKDKEVLMGDFMPLPPMPGLLALPSPLSVAYIHQLLQLCLAEGVDELVPIRFAELKALVSAKALFAEYGIQLYVPAALLDVPVFSTALAEQVVLTANGLKWLDQSGYEFLLLCDDADLR